MLHDEFIKKSFWPYVKNILKIFKDDALLQKKIRMMYRDEAHKLLEFEPTNKEEQHNKYISIIDAFKQLASKNIKKKELEYITMPIVKSPKTKRSKLNDSKLNATNLEHNKTNNSPKSKRSKTMNTSKKNFTRNLKKENLHKLLQKNWNNMLK